MSGGEGSGQRAGIARRLYGLLLRAYPADFRREYGEEAIRDFAALHGEAAKGGLRRVMALWLRTVADVLRSGMRERRSVNPHVKESNMITGGGGASRRGAPWPKGNLAEIGLAVRTLRRRPGLSLTIVALMALGTGATTAIFSVVHGVLLRPLPYPSSERLLSIQKQGSVVPFPDYMDLRENVEAFDAVGAVLADVAVLGGDEPQRLQLAHVTPEVIPLLGARAWRGRMLVESDHSTSAPKVAVISPELWLRRWGADPSVIGRTVRLSDEPYEIVGVWSPDFVPPAALRLSGVDVYIPLDVQAPWLQQRDAQILAVVARLRPGTTVDHASGQLDALSAALAEQYPRSWRTRGGEGLSFRQQSLVQATVGDIGRTLWLFLGAVGMLLLIACANVANLMLARSTERGQEMAVRSALGARRSRLLTQVLAESVVLSLIGGAAGAALAWGGVRAFQLLNPGGIPRVAEVAVDVRVLIFALGVSVLTGVLAAAVPAWLSARTQAGDALRESGVRTTETGERSRLRSGLVAAEIAIALILLTGASLLFSSFVRLRQVATGFTPGQLLTVQLDVPDRAGGMPRPIFRDALFERLASLPEVQSVAASWRLPFNRGRCCWNNRMTAAGPPGDTLQVYVHPVTKDYFTALGTPIVRGRDFNAEDFVSTPLIPSPSQAAGDNLARGGRPLPARENAVTLPAVISRSLAERLWPGQDPLGHALRTPDRDPIMLEVIGVIDGIRHWALDAERGFDAYLPFAAMEEWRLGLLDIAIRHDGPAAPLHAGVRAAVRELAPELPIDRFATMEQRISSSVAAPRFLAALLVTFALVAFLLAAAGVYGSMLYAVGLRRREMGIRLALGAPRTGVLTMVLGRGARIIALGTVIGLGGALALTRLMQSLLFETSATDPASFALAAALLAAAGLLACYLPARKAAAVDPMLTLRSE